METAIIARDAEALKRFYVDALGFTFERTYEATDPRFADAGLGAPVSIIFLNDIDGSRLKLLSATGDAQLAPPHSITETSGRALITVVRHDLDLTVQRVIDGGASLMRHNAVVELATGRRIVFLLDPEGNPIEVIQPAESEHLNVN